MAEYLSEGESGFWKVVDIEAKGEDPFALDLEWNKPMAAAHPLGIDIEVAWLLQYYFQMQ